MVEGGGVVRTLKQGKTLPQRGECDKIPPPWSQKKRWNTKIVFTEITFFEVKTFPIHALKSESEKAPTYKNKKIKMEISIHKPCMNLFY